MSAANKTELPTDKKLKDEFKKGNVAQSREVSTFTGLFAVLVLVSMIFPNSVKDVARALISFWDMPDDIPTATFADTLAVAWWAASSISYAFLAFATATFTLGLIGAAAQGKFVVSKSRIAPKLHKISPLSGIKRIVSLSNLFEFLKGVSKIGVVSIITALILMPHFKNADKMVGLPNENILTTAKTMGINLMFGLVIFAAVLAVIDRIYKQHEWKKRVMMTKQEIKDEMKQNDGDPTLKARRRDKARMMVKHRMMSKVPSATFIVTNPTHYAVALRYVPGENDAPVCVAKGIDNVALKIREIAGTNNIPVIENPPLARSLHKVAELEKTIPEEHFEAVAQVVTFVTSLKGRSGTIRFPGSED